MCPAHYRLPGAVQYRCNCPGREGQACRPSVKLLLETIGTDGRPGCHGNPAYSERPNCALADHGQDAPFQEVIERIALTEFAIPKRERPIMLVLTRRIG